MKHRNCHVYHRQKRNEVAGLLRSQNFFPRIAVLCPIDIDFGELFESSGAAVINFCQMQHWSLTTLDVHWYKHMISTKLPYI